MNELRDVTAIADLNGMSVLSLATGNRLGHIVDLFIDPVNGLLLGASVSLANGELAGLTFSEIHSFGRDAVMTKADESVTPLEGSTLVSGRPARKLIGTKIITEGGDLLGQITNVLVTLKPPPQIFYEARQSLLDKLLGREFYLPASLGNALSDDCARLVVPGITADLTSSDLANLVEQRIEVRTMEPGVSYGDDDDTVLVGIDEEETIVRFDDEDDTILRQPRKSPL